MTSLTQNILWPSPAPQCLCQGGGQQKKIAIQGNKGLEMASFKTSRPKKLYLYFG